VQERGPPLRGLSVPDYGRDFLTEGKTSHYAVPINYKSASSDSFGRKYSVARFISTPPASIFHFPLFFNNLRAGRLKIQPVFDRSRLRELHRECLPNCDLPLLLAALHPRFRFPLPDQNGYRGPGQAAIASVTPGGTGTSVPVFSVLINTVPFSIRSREMVTA
jgi:hypothetical protein